MLPCSCRDITCNHTVKENIVVPGRSEKYRVLRFLADFSMYNFTAACILVLHLCFYFYDQNLKSHWIKRKNRKHFLLFTVLYYMTFYYYKKGTNHFLF